VKGVLLILVQNLDVAAPKTLLDFIAKFPRVMCLVAVQTERAVAMQVKIRAFVGSAALTMPGQQADDVIARELIKAMVSTTGNDLMKIKRVACAGDIHLYADWSFSIRVVEPHDEISCLAFHLCVHKPSFINEM
jgi:hypothetical protein